MYFSENSSKNNEIRFDIRITSTNNATWQGLVMTEEGAYRFESELQLLNILDKEIRGGSLPGKC